MQIKREKKEPADLWLISYGDMVTVFFIFFVFVASISEISQAKLELLSEYFTGEKAPLTEAKEIVEKMIEDKELKEQLDVKITDKGLEINFSDKLLFQSGKADINIQGKKVLEDVSAILNKPELANRDILVEGHTDSVPIRTREFPSNWELSSSRACQVARYFIAQGVPSKRMKPTGYADTSPPLGEDGKPVEVLQNKSQVEMRRSVVIIK